MTGGPSFQVVFEDPHLIVVDKSARVLTVPTPRGERNTLVHLLARYLERRGPRGFRSSRPSRARGVEVVHRLDRDTSGLLVFAKDPRTGDELREQFRVHSVERVYLAIVAGRMKSDTGTFDSFLATNRGLDRYSTRNEGPGERAITHFRVRSRGADTSVVEARLETGRRNQIRVHFAEAGHPVLGDPRYGSRRAEHPLWPSNRLALHAIVLGLVHPLTREPMRWESPVPAVFRAFISKQIRGSDDQVE